MNKEAINKGYFNLVACAIEDCFRPVRKRKSGYNGESINAYADYVYNTKKRRREFADSIIVKLWCDASDNFEHKKLRRKILEFNS